MRPKRKDKGILKGVQVQGLRLKEDDVLVVKHPVNEDGYSLYDMKIVKTYHEMICNIVNCNVISIPANIELLKIKKDSAAYKELEKYKVN